MTNKRSESPDKLIRPESSDVEFRGDTQVVQAHVVPADFVPPTAALVEPVGDAQPAGSVNESGSTSQGD